jgi:hypothetical protein
MNWYRLIQKCYKIIYTKIKIYVFKSHYLFRCISRHLCFNPCTVILTCWNTDPGRIFSITYLRTVLYKVTLY